MVEAGAARAIEFKRVSMNWRRHRQGASRRRVPAFARGSSRR
jgi:hypothetical protein